MNKDWEDLRVTIEEAPHGRDKRRGHPPGDGGADLGGDGGT